MDAATAILSIGTAVGTLAKILVGAGLRGRWATVATFVVTTAVVALYGYSHNNFVRETTWTYFEIWIAVLLVAAGAFHVIENVSKETISNVAGDMKRTFTGTGDGTQKP